MISEEDLRKLRFHDDAIARLAVAAEALKTVGNTVRALEVARIRDEVIADHARFLTNAAHAGLELALSGGKESC